MYDLAVIGAGAGGIAAAKYALKRGLKVALIEKDKGSFGGICLNKGCIPTKFFIEGAKKAKGWEELFSLKEELIKSIKEPLLNYLVKNGIHILWGKATFLDPYTLRVEKKTISAKNIIVACGSLPKSILEKEKGVILAEEFFSLKGSCQRFLIVGAGFLGIEFASLLNLLNKKVVVVEKEPSILPSLKTSLRQRLRAILERKGIEMHTGTKPDNFNLEKFDAILVCVGRTPNLAEINPERIALLRDKNGWIVTNNYLQTNYPHIFACGDISGKKFLAYTAQYQGRLCIDNILGAQRGEDYSALAECVFSLPQLARVGICEEEAKIKNIRYKVIKTNFLNFSSSYVYADTDGFIQIILDENKKIIGVELISNLAAELANFFSWIIKHNLSLEELKEVPLIHPTLSEIIPLLLQEA